MHIQHIGFCGINLCRTDQGEKYAFVNEEFVSDLIRSYLFSDPDNIPVLNNKKDVVDNFVGTLLYYFKYREYSAKNIEIMLLAFEAGRGYQYSCSSFCQELFRETFVFY